MEIKINLSGSLNVDDYERIAKALRIPVDEKEVKAKIGKDDYSEKEFLDTKINLLESKLKEPLTGIVQASSEEYLEMILGKQVATRADDIIKRKIFHLIKKYYKNRLPTEAEIISIFQITETTSRRLLRELRASNRTDLEQEIDNSVRSVLENPLSKKSNDIIILIRSENILEEIKQTVSIEAAELDQVQKQKNSACSYGIPIDTYKKLCESYKIDYDLIAKDL